MVSMEISITLKITFNQIPIPFQKLVYFSHQSDQGKIGKTPIKNARSGSGKTVSNQFNV